MDGDVRPLQADGLNDPPHREILWIFSGLMLGMLLAALDQTIVAAALPTITGELGGLDQLSWVITAYLLASTASTPLYGKLGDLFGRKLLFQSAIVVFLIGSALCGIAQTMAQLILFRGVQGLGAGGLLVLAQAIMAEVVSPRKRARYSGYFGALFGLSSVGGPLIGGFLTDNASWRWVFYVNLPIGAVAMVITALRVPAGRRRPDVSVDYAGAMLLTATVSSIVLFATWGGTEYAWSSPMMVSLGIGSLGLLAVLIGVERRVPDPIVPLHLFREGIFKTSTSVSFILGVALYGALGFLPLFMQVVNGASATSSGLLLFPLMLGLIGASMFSGQVIGRTGRYKAFPIIGTALATVGLFLLSTMDAGTARSSVTVYMVVLGVGIGLSLQTLVLAVQNFVPAADLGAATSSVNFFRSMGGSVGVALFGTLFNRLLTDRLGASIVTGEGSTFDPSTIAQVAEPRRTELITAFSDSLTTVFLWAAPLMGLAFALSWTLREHRFGSSASARVSSPNSMEAASTLAH